VSSLNRPGGNLTGTRHNLKTSAAALAAASQLQEKHAQEVDAALPTKADGLLHPGGMLNSGTLHRTSVRAGHKGRSRSDGLAIV